MYKIYMYKYKSIKTILFIRQVFNNVINRDISSRDENIKPEENNKRVFDESECGLVRAVEKDGKVENRRNDKSKRTRGHRADERDEEVDSRYINS